MSIGGRLPRKQRFWHCLPWRMQHTFVTQPPFTGSPLLQLEAARQAAAASLASEPPKEWVDRFNGAPRKGCDILVQVRTAGRCWRCSCLLWL